METDPVVVVGSGLAGLVAAWSLAPQPCVLITAGALTEGAASVWAQGGVAAALGADDRPTLHAQDTYAAGAGYGDLRVIERITGAAPGVVRELAALGVPFDRTSDGDFDLALEGGHHRHRVAHTGDHSGATITQVMAGLVRALPAVRILENATVGRILLQDDAVAGVELVGGETVRTQRLILATGGLGGLYTHTTNPRSATGTGVALAARAGARTDDLHLVQFHPTALDVGHDPMPLLTEALRGAGARLLTDGHRFVEELQPRDVVAAAVWDQLVAGRSVRLDARRIERVSERFPSVTALCAQHGLDVRRDLLPVRPALHFCMGGVTVDEHARTTIPGLWAIGETGRTGLHGANRLASNSLLEAVVTARAAATCATVCPTAATEVAEGWPTKVTDTDPIAQIERRGDDDPAILPLVREVLERDCGVLRDGPGLSRAVTTLRAYADHSDAAYVGWLLARSALAHPLSIGAHRRTDEPELAVSA